MDRREFEHIVRETIEDLPEEFHHALENIAIVVRDEPDPQELQRDQRAPSSTELLGLYFGVPLTERDGGYIGIPDRIEIYRGPILRMCRTRKEIIEEIRDTVIHELGHHMGLSDGQMPY
jgi:predicted Zn-dependent protease with MMP-like domain